MINGFPPSRECTIKRFLKLNEINGFLPKQE